jgi:hypothetical protein
VADGHGSAKSFRSATGSRFAVEVSVALAAKLIEQDPLDLSFVKDQLEHGVPEQIVRDWLARVDADLSESPFSEEELLGVQERAGRPGLESVEASPRLAYGSTLLTVIATEAFVAFWQIGDGDLLTVSANGHVGEPVPGDEQLVADETTSLCSRDAWRSFRVGVLGTPVPMMMLSTDGFANSFQDNAGFRKFGTDVRDIILTEGLGMVRDKLDPWLNDITERGSGDDISLGIVCRPRALAGLPDEPPPPEPPEPGPEPEPGSTQVTVVLQRRNIVILAFVQVGRGFRYVFVRLPAQLFRSRSQET